MANKDYKAFIVEGEAREPQIIDNISKIFFSHGNYTVITLPVGENIYMLWKQLKADEFETDIIEVLRESNGEIAKQLMGLSRDDFSEVYKKLPLAYRGRYDIFTVETNGVLWMAIHPKDDVGLVMLRRDRAGVEKMTGLNCAIFLDRTTFYIKEKMMEEGIPFVIDGKQIFLPFVGYLLSKANERELAPVHLISFLTQKMLLVAIYERWIEMKVSDAAKRLGVSTKSASRCFDELEYLNIDVLGMKGKSRVINIPNDRKQVWQQIENVLRNPVIRRFVLREDMKLEKKAGISALCEYSLLSDNVYPTYAVTKKELKDSAVKVEKQVSELEEIGCVVLELGYFIDFLGKGFQDPLSVVLSLTGEEQEEERVDISINEMLEEYVWSKD